MSEAIGRWMLLHNNVIIVRSNGEYRGTHKARKRSVLLVECKVHLTFRINRYRDITFGTPIDIG